MLGEMKKGLGWSWKVRVGDEWVAGRWLVTIWVNMFWWLLGVGG
jgi:hypothetical protein